MKAAIAPGMCDIDRAQWNSLANPDDKACDPFLDWDFLEALERSGSVCPEAGWTPQHLLITDSDARPIGAMPLYLKMHSQGEYVFDHGWAEAFENAGGRYYPKLLAATPFTPVSGRRMLSADPAIGKLMIKKLIDLTEDNDLSSCHVNFTVDHDQDLLIDAGFLAREDRQFHWRNRQYGCFDDFLQALNSRKRKNIRKERQAAQDGLVFEHLTGAALLTRHWDTFFEFYQDTGARKWGFPYLNRQFFTLIHERMSDRILLIMARERGNEDYIGGALNFIGQDTLYGRYWGKRKERPFLHFETCYYQAMEFAIANKIKYIEAGAQGEHKLARGYEPSIVRSAHWIVNPSFRRAVADYLQQESLLTRRHGESLCAHTPFAAGDRTA